MRDTKVLIPLDGSAQAERPLAFVPSLRRLNSLSVRLVAAVDTAEETGPQRQERTEKGTKLLTAYLAEQAKKIAADNVKVEERVVEGAAAGVILEEGSGWNADLIAITTHGRSGLGRWRMGSVADKVVRSAECDTLVIGPHAVAEPVIRSILVPLDGSDLAEQALAVGKRLADGLGAKLHLLRVVPPPVLAGDGFEYSMYPEMLDATTEAATAYMQDRKAGLSSAETAVIFGAPSSVLLEYVEQNHIDLVVMTSHGRGGFLRAALGSVTDRMLGGPVPVFIVRASASHS